MPIEFKKSVAVFDTEANIEEAETLLQFFIENPAGKINLKKSQHLHTAVIQVLMAINPRISVPPTDNEVKNWLLPLLKTG